MQNFTTLQMAALPRMQELHLPLPLVQPFYMQQGGLAVLGQLTGLTNLHLRAPLPIAPPLAGG
jgi:hypothetical protein